MAAKPTGTHTPHHVRVVTASERYEGRQRADIAAGISAESVGARRLCMHLVTIPPGARGEIHLHQDHESALFILEGSAVTSYGPGLAYQAMAEAGDFVYIPAGMAHQAVNLSATEPVRAVLARTDPSEQESVVLLTSDGHPRP
ncbi:cupin domain-containing protein [Kitasatospora purpeofusca]|uniref:cupin domain-containing protein n=1 Tax=Kitasatospora purpeofusca TaxID=67352 RepID=UPI0036E00502